MPNAALAQPAEFDSFISGNDLYAVCKMPGFRPACMMYVAGAADAFMVAAANGGEQTRCMPSSVTAEQLTDIVIQSLEMLPQVRHYTAASLVQAAVENVFPCPQ